MKHYRSLHVFFTFLLTKLESYRTENVTWFCHEVIGGFFGGFI